MDLTLPPARHLTLGTVVADTAFFSGQGVLMGWSLRESTGAAPADCRLVDGITSAGDEVASIPLASRQGVREWFGPMGIVLWSGLFLDWVAGSIDAVAFVVLEEMLDTETRAYVFSGQVV